ncbi:MAG: transcription antitermination factor NusB [Oscillospiraceae bacterium]|nr:transcription antitermination factor NusB [Oscillospiraceae bacterium]
MTRRESRRTAFMLVFQKYSNDVSADEILDAAREDEELRTDEFCEQLVRAVCDHLPELDALIEPNLKKWTMARLPRVSLAVLRLSCAQLLFMPELPDSVVINEAVELAKEFGDEDEYAFVNGTLRSINIRLKEHA